MKSFSFLLSFFLFSILVFAQTPATTQTVSPVQIQSGAFNLAAGTEGYNLDKSTGERSTTLEVTFEKPFDKKPKVVLAADFLDTDTKTNLRYKIEAISISRDGFTIKVSTWADTKIFGIGGNWLAYNAN
jgi:hypothetical protein